MAKRGRPLLGIRPLSNAERCKTLAGTPCYQLPWEDEAQIEGLRAWELFKADMYWVSLSGSEDAVSDCVKREA
jgi:hypothetical protein